MQVSRPSHVEYRCCSAFVVHHRHLPVWSSVFTSVFLLPQTSFFLVVSKVFVEIFSGVSVKKSIKQPELDRNKKLVVTTASDSFRTKRFISTSAGPSVRPSDPGVCGADSADQGWTGTRRRVWMMSRWCQRQAGSRYTPQNVYSSSFLSVSATVLFQLIFHFRRRLFKEVVSPPVIIYQFGLFTLFYSTYFICNFSPSALLRPLCLINLFWGERVGDSCQISWWLPSSHNRWLRFKHMGGGVAPALVSAALPLTFLPLCLEGYWWAIFRCCLYNTEHRGL